MVARKDHSLEVVSSSLTPATIYYAEELQVSYYQLISIKMEREELLGQVNEVLENEGSTLTLSEETINGELDDALEDIENDDQVDEAFVNKIVKRLKRMNGNLHKDVSTQVKEYKKAHPAPKSTPKPKGKKGDDEEDEDDVPDYIKKLNARLDAMEQSRKTEAETKSKNDTLAKVKKGLKTKFSDAKIEVKDYFVNQAINELKLPQLEEGETYDVDDLVNKAEKLYHKHLKAAGFDPENVGPKFGRKTGNGTTAADRYWERKKKRENWGSGTQK